MIERTLSIAELILIAGTRVSLPRGCPWPYLSRRAYREGRQYATACADQGAAPECADKPPRQHLDSSLSFPAQPDAPALTSVQGFVPGLCDSVHAQPSRCHASTQ